MIGPTHERVGVRFRCLDSEITLEPADVPPYLLCGFPSRHADVPSVL